jgi:HSP20 family protein
MEPKQQSQTGQAQPGQVPPEGQQLARGTTEQQQGAGEGGKVATTARGTGDDVGVLRPPVDVIEDATGITLIADLPGVSKDNLHVRYESQSLTIEAAMTLDLPADMEPRHAEIRHQHYERTFALSRELNAQEATAELSNGVLRLRIPKSHEAVPRKIPVTAA